MGFGFNLSEGLLLDCLFLSEGVFTLVNGALEPILLRIREREKSIDIWYKVLILSTDEETYYFCF